MNRFNLQQHVTEKPGPRVRPRRTLRAIGHTAAGEIDFYRLIRRRVLVPMAVMVRKQGMPLVVSLQSQLTHDSVGGISYFAQQLRRFALHLLRTIEPELYSLFVREEQRQRASFESSVRANFGIDISGVLRAPDVSSDLQTAMLDSVNYITGITDEVAKRVVGILIDAGQQGTRSTDLAKQLSATFGWSNKRAKLIARDQLATFNGVLNKTRQTQVGITHYEWSTSLDERVRPTHVEREGRVFAWNNPPADGHPGQPINCRCVARAVIHQSR